MTLHLWVASNRRDGAPLDTTLCHAMQNVGDHRVSRFRQCHRKPKAERPFIDGKSYPVCGVHAIVYDKAAERVARQDREARADAELVRSIQARLKALGVDAHVEWSSHVLRHTNRVILTIDELERVLKNGGR